jgi:hypothetical protein
MTDQWNEQLRCPQCRNTSIVNLSQFESADMPTVDRITDSFKVVQTDYGPNFHCGVCDVPALP